MDKVQKIEIHICLTACVRLTTKGKWFIDDQGRKLLLRGVNLSGSKKMPIGEETHIETDFSNHRDVSFVGRPFTLGDAPSHFERLKHWGFNCIRLLTTWEAIEHAGPGQYDSDYLDYFVKITDIAGDYGMYVFIDPHQDVWSRMTGGDGAPGWVFEKVGLDMTKFGVSEAAKVMQYHYPDNYDAMEWYLNYSRFSVATMFTLFFGSEHFAPQAMIEGQSVQKYLQSHFIDSMTEVAKRVKDMEHVIGFDMFNEPSGGYIGIRDLNAYPELTPPGVLFTGFDSIASGSGHTRRARRYGIRGPKVKVVGYQNINPEGINNWIDPEADIWLNHGIFEVKEDEPILLRPDHFARAPDGSAVNFESNYLRPFSIEYINSIREYIPDALLFIEGVPNDPVLTWLDNDPKGVVNASHWYDGFTLITKTYIPWLTINQDTMKPILFAKNVRDYHLSRLSQLGKESAKIHGGIPTLVGEFGIPFDFNRARAYKTGNFSSHIKALDSYYNLIDELQYHSTQWNYTADNNNKWGDLWNMEDLSIYSKDQEGIYDGIDNGGRAIEGFCRPYPIKTAGTPISWEFNRNYGYFHYRYHATEGTTEIFLPKIQFRNPSIQITPQLPVTYEDQTLSIKTDTETDVVVDISEF